MGTVYFHDYTFLNFPKLLTISVHFTVNHSVRLTIKTLINDLFLYLWSKLQDHKARGMS